jgi:hypothetical protein
MPASTVTLIGKPGCHLCDDARLVVTQVLTNLGETGVVVGLEERSITDEPRLAAAYAEDIPVVLVDGRPHARWRVDPERLRADLLA